MVFRLDEAPGCCSNSIFVSEIYRFRGDGLPLIQFIWVSRSRVTTYASMISGLEHLLEGHLSGYGTSCYVGKTEWCGGETVFHVLTGLEAEE